MNRFHFEPTSFCQVKCKLCPNRQFGRKRTGFMDIGKFKRFIQQAVSEEYMMKGDDVHLWGFGEPTLHAGLPEMVNTLSDHGLTSKINTNGISLTPSVWDRLQQAGLSRCLVSLDAVTPEVYNLYRVGGDFKKVTENLTNACRNAGNTIIESQCVVFSHNQESIDEFIKYSGEVGAHFATIKRARTWDGSPEGYTGFEDLRKEYVRSYENSSCRFHNDMY